jgi:hypothetical protein
MGREIFPSEPASNWLALTPVPGLCESQKCGLWQLNLVFDDLFQTDRLRKLGQGISPQ